MLVTLNEVLKDAQKQKYAVGLFNTVNLEMAKGVLAAAEELNSPVIIGTAEVLLPYSTLEELALILVPMAKRAKVPVVLHFDHGLTLDCVHKAIALGFSSVMYDCSTKSYKENVRDVKAMVEYAHSRGISARKGTEAGITASIRIQWRRRYSRKRREWTRWRWRSGRRTGRTRASRSWILSD